MTIDVRGPDGNVFVILGAVRGLKRELNSLNCPTPEIDALLKNFQNMKYDAILDKVEEVTNGSITFIGRDYKERDTDE